MGSYNVIVVKMDICGDSRGWVIGWVNERFVKFYFGSYVY